MKRFEIYERETDIYICFKNTREEALKCIRKKDTNKTFKKL